MHKFFSSVHAQTIQQLPATTDLDTIFKNIISWALYLGGAIAVIYIIYGGFTYITAGGDTAKAEQGRNTLTYAIIGLILIALSFVIVTWVNDWIQGRVR